MGPQAITRPDGPAPTIGMGLTDRLPPDEAPARESQKANGREKEVPEPIAEQEFGQR